jgi:hypothetical protein
MEPRVLLLLSLLVAGLLCACASQPAGEPAGASKSRGMTDSLCLNDCLGSGATRSFCQDRCTN